MTADFAGVRSVPAACDVLIDIILNGDGAVSTDDGAIYLAVVALRSVFADDPAAIVDMLRELAVVHQLTDNSIDPIDSAGNT